MTVQGQAFNHAWDILQAYQTNIDRLPQILDVPTIQTIKSFDEVIDLYDLFLFDAFGVLNIGDQVIPGAAERIKQLQQLGKKVMLVSNAASQPASVLIQKYQAMGFDFDTSNSVFSRETLIKHWPQQTTGSTGIVGISDADYSDLPFHYVQLKDDALPYQQSERFVYLSTSEWNLSRQSLLESSLADRPRPTWVANPDLVAPREYGMSLEPGFYASTLHSQQGLDLTYFGKPFSNIFEVALDKANYKNHLNKVLMIGDTLHTDILGAKAMGFHAMLVTGFGACKGLDLPKAFPFTGIYPDYVLPQV